MGKHDKEDDVEVCEDCGGSGLDGDGCCDCPSCT